MALAKVATIALLLWPSLSAEVCSFGAGSCQERDETSLLQVKREVVSGNKRPDAKSPTVLTKVEAPVVLEETSMPVRSAGADLKDEIAEKATAEKAALDSQFPGMIPLGITNPGSGVVSGDFVPGIGSGVVQGYMPGAGAAAGYAPGFGPGFPPGVGRGVGSGVVPAVVVMPPGGVPGVAPGMTAGVTPGAVGSYAPGSYAPGYAPTAGVHVVVPGTPVVNPGIVPDASGYMPGIAPGRSARAAAVAARAGAERAVAQSAATVAEHVAAKATVQQAAAQNAAAAADAGSYYYGAYHRHNVMPLPSDHRRFGDVVQIVPIEDMVPQPSYPVYQQAATYPVYQTRYYPDDVA